MKVSRILPTTGLTLALGIATAVPALAAEAVTQIGAGLNSAAKGAGYSGAATASQLPIIVGSIISILLQLVGVLLLGYLIYAGFLWMTAGGDKTKVEKATTTIRNAVIGLVIIVLANAIASYVLGSLNNAVAGGTTTQEAPTPAP